MTTSGFSTSPQRSHAGHRQQLERRGRTARGGRRRGSSPCGSSRAPRSRCRDPAAWCSRSTFCVTTASTSPRRSSSASARCAAFGLRVREHAEPLGVEVPDLRRVAPERVDRRVLHRVVLRPDAGPRPEVGDPALGRDARAGEDDAGLRLQDQLGETLGAHGRDSSGRMEGFSFSTEIAVRFAETDAQGIAHNATYLVWYEVARIEYLARFRGGYKSIQADGYEALTTESHVRYLKPVFFDDRSGSTPAASTSAARGSATSTCSSGTARSSPTAGRSTPSSTARRSGRPGFPPGSPRRSPPRSASRSAPSSCRSRSWRSRSCRSGRARSAGSTLGSSSAPASASAWASASVPTRTFSFSPT